MAQPGPARSRHKALRIIDGDTITSAPRRGLLLSWLPAETIRIRLSNIDAPESDQPGGDLATQALAKMVKPGDTIWLESSGNDQYGRNIAVLHPGKDSPPDKSYNYRMVADGYAHTYMVDPLYKELYGAALAKAKGAKKGIWKSERTSKVPREHRAKQQQSAAAQQKAGNLIFLLVLLAIAAAILIFFAATDPGRDFLDGLRDAVNSIALPLLSR